MPEPQISIDEYYGWLEIHASNKNGVCTYHFYDSNYYPPVSYQQKLFELSQLQ